jgi:hypothetical protein
MKDFDIEQQGHLGFLAKQGAHLHFPFFANTFSLAYHYASCLLDHVGREWPETRTLISEHNWEKPYPSLVSGKPNVFYATKKGFRDLEKENSNREGGPEWQLVGVPFTRYRPRYLFTDYRASLLSRLQNNSRNQRFPENLVHLISNDKIHHLEIFTDIPGQCEAVISHMNSREIKEIELIEEPKDALRPIDPGHKVLRLYFYGAPTTTKMLNDSVRFIPFEIPDEVVWEEPTTITQICFAKPVGIPLEENEAIEFHSAMEKYHARIFDAASNDRHTELANVWWAYNRYAERKQHTAIFKTTEVFARCLKDHHLPYRAENGGVLR